jgi:hypothetical protein
MEETHQDSLAAFLRLKHAELCSLLLAYGLALLHGQQFRMNRRLNRSEVQSSYSWQQFVVEQNLDGYFDSMTVNKLMATLTA